METYLIVAGILLVILGILALLVPQIARFISFPGNERIKAFAVIIAGLAVALYGFFFL